MLEKTSTPDNQLSKEDYLIMRAKDALPVDIYAAKSWLITAKSLFPHSAKVQVRKNIYLSLSQVTLRLLNTNYLFISLKRIE